MSFNAPDDWHAYFRRCPDCGTRYHASEGGCSCSDETECAGCHCGMHTDELERDENGVWHTQEGNPPTCEDCGWCCYCGATGPNDTIDVRPNEDDEPVCRACREKGNAK
jgi:hypothetical protein